MPATLPESLRMLAKLLEAPQNGIRLGYLAQHLLRELDACRSAIVDALLEGSEQLGIPRPMRDKERESYMPPSRHDELEEALLDHELNRVYGDYLATNPEDVRGRVLARLYLERAMQRRYPM
jgi:hypothetical protein